MLGHTPLTLWGDILVDGHHRYKICMEHDLPFQTRTKEFDSRYTAMEWMIAEQVSRRNLTQIQLVYFRGMHYEMSKKRITNERGKNQYKEVMGQNDPQPEERTSQKVADLYGVAEKTIRRDGQVANAINKIGETSPAAKQKIIDGEVDINKHELAKLSIRPPEEIKAVAKKIEKGEKLRPEKPVDENDGVYFVAPDIIPAPKQRIYAFINGRVDHEYNLLLNRNRLVVILTTNLFLFDPITATEYLLSFSPPLMAINPHYTPNNLTN